MEKDSEMLNKIQKNVMAAFGINKENKEEGDKNGFDAEKRVKDMLGI